MNADDRRAHLRRTKETLARVSESSEQMRARSRAQREVAAEMRRRRAEDRRGEVRIERLWPALEAPEGVEVRGSLPRGPAPVVLVCGVCDEELAAGTFAADLHVALRCPACLAYNTRRRSDLL